MGAVRAPAAMLLAAMSMLSVLPGSAVAQTDGLLEPQQGHAEQGGRAGVDGRPAPDVIVILTDDQRAGTEQVMPFTAEFWLL